MAWVEVKAVTEEYEKLAKQIFPHRRVVMLHGRMKPQEKDEIMKKFKNGDYDMLVSTSVVEVGVDIPNAAIMMIESAERFGLAQLHQLRGRVGRGARQSFCVLLSSKRDGLLEGEGSQRRLQALVQSADGFAIAEEDLRLRGPGEFLGVRQWGLPEFRVANLIRDGALLAQARQEAFALVAGDPGLSRPEHQALKAAMLRRWQDKVKLGSVS